MVPATLVPVEEYLNTSFQDGDREYVDGRIVERNVGEVDHSDLQGAMAVYLRLIYKPRFWAGIAVRVRVAPARVRVPDISVIAGPRPEGRIIVEPPLLVIEVLSPDDRADELQEKIDDYLGFGIPFVWVVNPRTRRGYVHTAAGSHEAKDGVLRAQDPAIELPLAEMFE